MQPPNNILIVRFSSLGDVALSAVVVPDLKRAFPRSRISLLTKAAYQELFQGRSVFDEILALRPGEGVAALSQRLKERSFDLILDLHGNLRSRILRLLLPSPRWEASPREIWRRRLLVYAKLQAGRPHKPVTERYLDVLQKLGIPPENRLPRIPVPAEGASQDDPGLNDLPQLSLIHI